MVKRKRNPFSRFKRTTARKRTRKMPTVRLIRTRTRRTFARPTSKKSGIVRDRRMVSMRYAFKITLTADAFRTYQFRANSLFDPDITGVGHQPRGFDQYMILYDKYAVVSSKITVKAWDPRTVEPFMLSIRVKQNTTASDATYFDAVENPGGMVRFGTAQNGRPPLSVRASVNVAKFFNRSGGIADDPDLQGTASSNPNVDVWYDVHVSPIGALNAGALDMVGWIDYRVMLLEPKKIGGS